MQQLAKLGAVFVVSLALGSLALGGAARAQDATPSATDATTEVKAASYVTESSQDDMFGVQSSQLALEKSGNPKVRAFAQHVMTDHTAFTRGLTRALTAAKVDAAPASALDPQQQQLIDILRASHGADFDRKYLRMQMDAHQEALRTQVDYRLHGGNAKLQDFAADASMMVQRRLSELGKISQGSLLPQP